MCGVLNQANRYCRLELRLHLNFGSPSVHEQDRFIPRSVFGWQKFKIVRLPLPPLLRESGSTSPEELYSNVLYAVPNLSACENPALPVLAPQKKISERSRTFCHSDGCLKVTGGPCTVTEPGVVSNPPGVPLYRRIPKWEPHVKVRKVVTYHISHQRECHSKMIICLMLSTP
ncbi:hypothetical protein L211DRAFT_13929 [Terfezia boudieri ATCC MYA-4762]|uniref:Uncharacterized protein n=1 Tax=Terfezia boudieri ATCC MYA-4762 TaxID=1051890 RepID=A0A3N4M6K5_9PEZI|nr:hypothetical protein L211DRAFT_13929 [Terfezia boudieri ATCC MYA-4762]